MADPHPPARELPPSLGWAVRYRAPLALLANLAVLAGAYAGAFLLRFDLRIPRSQERLLLLTIGAATLIHLGAFWAFKLTRGWWRYVGVSDFLNAVKAAALGGLGLATYVFLFHRKDFYPRSVFLLNFVLVVGLTIGLRLIVRLWRQLPGAAEGPRKRLLIIGAGDTGEGLLREIRQSPRLPYHVVGFVDDDPRKRGAYINGIPVLGSVADIPLVARRLDVDEIIVATPSASGEEMRDIIRGCRAAEKPFKVMPATWEVLGGRAGLGSAREVDINDLLRRPPVELDAQAIGRFLRGKRVVVTGAAGSIGAEICRQVLRREPVKLVCIDHDENALFYLERQLAPLRERVDLQFRLGDVTDEGFVDSVFARVKPEVVFHAAAHKHVPLIEANPLEGIRNNVFGTETVATLAGRHAAEAFVLISTDKAVNPSSMMGATKRIAELLVRTLPFQTRYTAVRFGNVLGSQGSVVPILKEQLAAGGPITITHPEMERYFMTIPEAVELVIQASAMGQGDQVFMLDMGQPVKIVDLASDLITLSGLRPGVDVPIVFTGIRPGEKLREELHLADEAQAPTTHAKILVATHTQLDERRFSARLDELRAAVARQDEPEARRLVAELVPQYLAARAASNVVPITAARTTGPRATTKG